MSKAKIGTIIDSLGPNHPGGRKIPMYSFERPSRLVWSGYAEALAANGLSENQIIEVLRSKHTRWGLDHHEDFLIEFGKSMVNADAIEFGKSMPEESEDGSNQT